MRRKARDFVGVSMGGQWLPPFDRVAVEAKTLGADYDKAGSIAQ
jgi:hypothetical protein